MPVKDDPLGLRFTQDYFPGTKDPQGRLIAATEANQLVAHRGQLFASFGATYRNPPTPDPDFQGFGVLRKETAGGPWLVDLDLGPRPYRVEVMASLSFHHRCERSQTRATRRASRGRPLVAEQDDPGARTMRTRKWDEKHGGRGAGLPLGCRVHRPFVRQSCGSEDTKSTTLFAGAWQGHGGAVGEYRSSIYRAAYDPRRRRAWVVAEPELQDVGRIMAMAECNGDLYATCCIFDDSPLSGGIFRRIDGPQAALGTGLSLEGIRPDRLGRRAADDPRPDGRARPERHRPRQVLIGFRFFPEPIIERIDPQQGHKATVELNLKDFFGQAFHGGGRYIGTIRCAYNPFTAVTDPRTGKTVHLGGVQIYHPGFPEPAPQRLALPHPPRRRHLRLGTDLRFRASGARRPQPGRHAPHLHFPVPRRPGPRALLRRLRRPLRRQPLGLDLSGDHARRGRNPQEAR